MKLGCIVLAAGKSVRFGPDKLLADLSGRSVLCRTLNALPAAYFEKCIAVCASEAVERCIRSCGIKAARYGGGALSDSIRVGLSAIPGVEGWLFMNGDQPLLHRRSLIRMIEAFEKDPHAVYRLSFGEVQASPALFPGEMLDALLALKGEEGGMCAARRSGIRIVPVPADAAAELWDVDDEALFARARKYLSENPSYREE